MAGLAPRPWRNGAGTTRLVHAQATWQLSVAELGEEAEFSLFAGHDRAFTLLDGEGAKLESADHAPLPCHPLVPALFPGERIVRYKPAGGPARAFNVITLRGVVRAEVRVASLAGACRVSSHTAAIFCVRGQITIGADILQAGDTALLSRTCEGDVRGDGLAIFTSLHLAVQGSDESFDPR